MLTDHFINCDSIRNLNGFQFFAMNNYVYRVFFLPLTYVGNFVTFKRGNTPKTCSCPFLMKSCSVFSRVAKLHWVLLLAAYVIMEVSPPCPTPASGAPERQEGWSPAVTLAIINIVGTPAQKNTGLEISVQHLSGIFRVSFCGLRQYVCPTHVLQRHKWTFYSLWTAGQFFKLILLLSVKIWGEIVSFSTSASGTEGRAVWETCACSVSVMHLLCVLFRYDHTRPSAAAGGAVGSMPHSVPSPGFHSPHPPSDLTAPIVKTNLHEPGKREKRTLVLRDRSEWAESFCCLFLKSSLVLFFIFLSGLLTRGLLT